MTNHPNRNINTRDRRVARVLNAKRGQGGFCVFGADGSGGHWYSDGSYPSLGDGQFRMSVPHHHITAAYVGERIEMVDA